ncbi:PAAR-like domain-containing protein [Archangium sp.]|uniref:PAAR-like domain-containing protein n=1 Tax=Archangium sp. TaxID=1872627 RepID=UPI002D53A2FF|nr:PAAR-like domain-containing protein [Archangium sp.]HYO59311.1 PAAR-like domain-containing protein [Archangium sp.]
MSTVGVNPPKTAVTKGSSGVAAATLPNVCKMPGPPAPFVPTPLPNIGMSGSSPEGYSKTVTIEGEPVAIQGASFGSQGDIASKPTGGGLVSANTHGPTKFLGPGSMNVKIEGKNVQLLGDPMLNNCGPSGSPANAATMAGLVQVPEAVLHPEEENQTQCTTEGDHRYEVHEAKGKESLEQKISTAKKATSLGTQFEGHAAEHNMKSGELQRSSQLSGDAHAEKIFWKCAECGHSREGDQLHDGSTPGAAPIAVEVKSKSKLEPHDLVQLGRNIKTVKQGGASGLIYKLPVGRAGKYIAYSIRAIGKKVGCAIRIVRV